MHEYTFAAIGLVLLRMTEVGGRHLILLVNRLFHRVLPTTNGPCGMRVFLAGMGLDKTTCRNEHQLRATTRVGSLSRGLVDARAGSSTQAAHLVPAGVGPRLRQKRVEDSQVRAAHALDSLPTQTLLRLAGT